MAQIVIKNEEIVNLIKRNMPPIARLSDIQADGANIKLIVKTAKLLPSASVTLEFAGYEQSKIVFNIQANSVVRFIIDALKSNAPEWLTIDAGQIALDINYLLTQKMNGIKITNVLLHEDGTYLVDVEFV